MKEQGEADVEFPEFPGPKGSGRAERLLGMVTFLGIVAAAGIVMVFALAGCATAPEPEESSSFGAEKEAPGGAAQEAPHKAAGEQKLGIRAEGLRLSAAGYVLDFRYRVIDPAKAAPLLDKKIRPYLLDEASGAQLGVPDTAKLGQLRTTGRNGVVHDRDYFILFANPGRFVQTGSKMTLVMGDSRIENLTVE